MGYSSLELCLGGFKFRWGTTGPGQLFSFCLHVTSEWILSGMDSFGKRNLGDAAGSGRIDCLIGGMYRYRRGLSG